MRPVIVTLLLLGLAACRGKAPSSTNAPQAGGQAPAPTAAGAPQASSALPPGHPPIDGMAAGSAGEVPRQVGAPPFLKGTILETMDAANYTYMKLKTADGEVWAAVNQSKVKKGQEVTVMNPAMMENFESKTLKRTFDHIIFGSLGGDAPAAMPGMPGAAPAGSAGAPNVAAAHAGIGSEPANVGDVKTPKAEGADAKTVAEVHAEKAKLENKSVSVRGKVVKFLPGIMGKNWIHLRDGSGSHEKGDDDLTVTTLDTVAMGETVTIKGTVHTNRDFGAGYSYAVIVEDAKAAKK